MGSHEPSQQSGNSKYLFATTLGALGVVYGDIGTSPLYAMRECFQKHGEHAALEPTHDNVLGILSLIFWSLILVVTLKYLVYVMRADNRGEGGVLALMTLAHPRPKIIGPDPRAWMILLGLFGAALLYGDGMITPAISVLSAVEGLKVATPVFEKYVIPITIAILCLLFIPQKHGTGRIGAIFGPVIVVWFAVLGLLGLRGVVTNPSVIEAFLPHHAIVFLWRNGWHGFLSLGAVFLVVTGGEALYADMGHFGKKPIQLGWVAVALPGLMLNYLGQGALLLRQPELATNPFYHLAPQWAIYPLVGLATMATVIASQALISGAFSLTRQAVQLGYLPRMEIRHTSADEMGQIYVPWVNWGILAATIFLVLYFGSSSAMAAAYGIAVTATMIITTILIHCVARDKWGWKPWPLHALTASLLLMDFGFFGANFVKVFHGGWFPIAVGLAILTLMTTWWRGRIVLGQRLQERLMPIAEFLKRVDEAKPARVPGAAIFMTSNASGAPQALVHNMKHNHVLHESVLLVQVRTEEMPHVPDEVRDDVEKIADGIYRVTLSYGFMETPHVPEALKLLVARGFKIDLDNVTYFLGRETLISTRRPGMSLWREELFSFMSRNAQQATAFFHIPHDRVIEIGMQVEM